jgi:hypothetical protein
VIDLEQAEGEARVQHIDVSRRAAPSGNPAVETREDPDMLETQKRGNENKKFCFVRVP